MAESRTKLRVPQRGKQAILNELRIKLEVALTDCLLFQLGAKDLSSGSMERRIFDRKWLEVKDVYRRIKLVNDHY